MAALGVLRKVAGGREQYLMGCFDAVLPGDRASWAHVRYPGSPARVAGQEEKVFTKCPVHVAGRAADVSVRAA